jgi:hypothetical protein
MVLALVVAGTSQKRTRLRAEGIGRVGSGEIDAARSELELFVGQKFGSVLGLVIKHGCLLLKEQRLLRVGC